MITSYDGLIEEVGQYLDRDDLATRVPTFIHLTEARLNRLLEDPEMEVLSSATANGETTVLPLDFGGMVSISDGLGRPLRAMGSQEFAGIDRSVAGDPRFYVVEDGSISFAPANSSANIRMVYRRTLPPLSASNVSNWLLERAPDVYLYGCLVQASAFLVEDERVPLWKSAFDESIGELRADGARRKWGAGPIGPRIDRP